MPGHLREGTQAHAFEVASEGGFSEGFGHGIGDHLVGAAVGKMDVAVRDGFLYYAETNIYVFYARTGGSVWVCMRGMHGALVVAMQLDRSSVVE